MRPICNIREFSKNEEHLSIKNEIFPDPIYQKGKILEYLQGFNPDCAAGMSLKDEITGQTTDKGVSGYSDEEGVWYWDDRMVYHFEKYNMRLFEDFLDYVLSK